tara:strand:- start:11178 stop:12434 length:1257 start_codon:yes stop_codon:yes gene_type:complete
MTRGKKYEWTNDEDGFLIVMRMKGFNWSEIARQVNAKFKRNTVGHVCKTRYNTIMGIDVKTQFTTEQSDFVRSMFLNNFRTPQIITGFKEQYQRIINEDDIDFILTQTSHEDKVEKEIKTQKEKIKKEMKRMKPANAWTKEQEEELLACGSWSKAMKLDNGRSVAANNQRWSLLKKQGRTPAKKPASSKPKKTKEPKKTKKPKKPKHKGGRLSNKELDLIRKCGTVEEALALNLRKPETIIRYFATLKTTEPKQPKPEKIARKERGTAYSDEEIQLILSCDSLGEVKALKVGNRSSASIVQKYYSLRKQYPSHFWNQKDEYDLVLNFYELSIDEARKRFNRSYGEIATRLEKIVDSTEPKYISMLMEASTEIKARKEAEKPKPKQSRRMLRKARKKAKKEAKLKAKLQKLRGEKDGKQ